MISKIDDSFPSVFEEVGSIDFFSPPLALESLEANCLVSLGQSLSVPVLIKQKVEPRVQEHDVPPCGPEPAAASTVVSFKSTVVVPIQQRSDLQISEVTFSPLIDSQVPREPLYPTKKPIPLPSKPRYLKIL